MVEGGIGVAGDDGRTVEGVAGFGLQFEFGVGHVYNLVQNKLSIEP